MSEMVLLKCIVGSKAATVLCPECGRISRQILYSSYNSNQTTRLLRTHACPICKTEYQTCSSSQIESWSAAYLRYSRNADEYNQIVKNDYEKKCKLESGNVGSNSPILIANNSWQRLFSTTILKRGRAYYNAKRVNITTRTDRLVLGTVNGTESYAVSISLDGSQVKKMSCNCPYALSGQRCKHQAAMLFDVSGSATNKNCEMGETAVSMKGVAPNSKMKAGQATLASAMQEISEKKKNNPEDTTSAKSHLGDCPAPVKKEMSSSATTEIPGQSLGAVDFSPMLNTESSHKFDDSIDRKIERWKRKLLDTGKGNKMINFRETKRATLRILEPEASILFGRLVSSEKPLTFQKPINKDSDLRTYSMIALMETLSYTLSVQVGDIKAAGTIIEREKTLKNLRSKAKLAQEEQGTNILYLCFGFIYWREHDRESSPWLKAPLLMMPVSLGLKSLNSPFTLSRYDDEVEVNPTLDYLFNNEYHIDLPAFEMKNGQSEAKIRQDFEDYITQIEEIVDKHGWKVTREVSLGLLSFLKISMYHDLNEHRELMVDHPVLRAMAGDRTAIDDLPPQADHFDFDSVKPDEWHEVVNSDSSQEEAILLSKLGVSFVMQGPPGTGKSQTITNIIAEALADGKKVLFVSEKAAALQVVLKRLAEVGLDDFCLSIHNYKANKKEIIDSIGANLSLKSEYVDQSALSELTELFHDRAFLNDYAKELHKAIAPLDQSVYMAFGRISKLEKAPVLDFSIESPTEITREQYAAILYCISAFEKVLHNLDGKLSENPWCGTKAISSGQTYKLQLLHDTEHLSDNLRKIAELAGKIDSKLGSGMIESFSDAKTLLDITTVLGARPAYISPTWFDKEVVVQGKERLANAKRHSERLHQYRNAVLNEWNNSILFIDSESIREHFCGDYAWIYNSEDSADIKKRLDSEQSKAEELKRTIEDILSTYHEGLTVLSYKQEDTANNIRMVAQVLRLIADAPYMEASWFDVRKNAEIAPLVDEAVAHSASISSLSEEILKDWEPTVFEIDADGILARFKTEYVGMFHTLKSRYKEDIKTLRLHLKAVGGKIDETAVIAFLQKVKELKMQKAWFDANSEALKVVLGNQYRGEATEWNRVRESMSKALEITNEFPYSSIPEKTVSALLHITDNLQLSGEVRRLAAVLSVANVDQIETEIRNSRYINNYTSDCNIAEVIVPQINIFIGNCGIQSEYIADFTASKKNGVFLYENIIALLSNLSAIKEETTWFDNNGNTLRNLFADAYQEGDSDWDAILRGYDTVDCLTGIFSGPVPETVIAMACSQSEDPHFQSDISEFATLISETDSKLKVFSAQFEADDFATCDMITVADRYDACISGFGELNKWLDYIETREECDKHGLSDFTAKIAERDNTVSDVQDAFERGFYTQWLSSQLDNVPAVQAFRRRIHEQRSERFVKLDAKQYETARKTIRKRIIDTYPDLNRIARAGSELGILHHEMGKKKRVMALRKLFQSIPNLLLTLKPCLMMSPLSVAYFLDAEKYHFDMVIFDEASQIFPQDAIGAIFRAKQVIIAGDTKQLPPTNFFAANTSNSSEGYDDDEGYDEEIYDSILEETANILPNRTLLWHYRSKHEHLIAFSNQEIYKNDLVTFPSSNESAPDTGVEFVYVADGYYEPSPRNYNILEAKRIVELVKKHIEKYPDRSLGIIAFSEKQQQAISLEIQKFREKHSEYESFFTEEKEDEFFVKNLENVQGDERDTIFFSVGYAKTKEQKANNRPMSMRFGPLGISGGERRLNVAITRAKINVKLVSSILPSDIDLSRTESDGIRMLRAYIEFAMNGQAALAVAHKNNRPDDFADFIAQFIKDHGYKVQQYVGCSGYKIDIAVEHPSDTVKQFVAGIECDGVSYAAARTARDRDRLRSTVLKNMGWNLYRVWSAEWYKDPEIEGQRLIAFLQKAIKSCDKKVMVLEEEKLKEAEAKRAELEKAKAIREEDERERRQEQEAREAALKAEQEDIRKREEEKKRAEEQRRIEAETKQKKVDCSWVKSGVHVRHNRYGTGTVLEVMTDTLRVVFGTVEKTFAYPSVIENGILTRLSTIPEVPKEKGPDWAVIGAPVYHKSFGKGVIESIGGERVTVKFGDETKSFFYPTAFTGGHLTRERPHTVPITRQELLSRAALQNGEQSAECDGSYAADPIKNIDSIRQISDYLIENGRYRDNMLFIVGINLGLRVGDLRVLRFSDLMDRSFAFKDRFLIKTKNGREHRTNMYITLSHAVREAVTLYLEHTPGKLSDYMFRRERQRVDPDQPLSREYIDLMLKGIDKDLGLGIHMSTHTLRKTWAYFQMAAAKDHRELSTIIEALGYRTFADTLDYVGATETEIQDAHEVLLENPQMEKYICRSQCIEQEDVSL